MIMVRLTQMSMIYMCTIHSTIINFTSVWQGKSLYILHKLFILFKLSIYLCKIILLVVCCITLVYILIKLFLILIKVIKDIWNSDQIHPAAYILFFVFKLYILFFILTLTNCIMLDGFLLILIKVIFTIGSLFIFYPLMDKKITFWSIFLIIFVSFILVPHLHLSSYITDFLIYYLILGGKICKSVFAVIMEDATTGNMRRYPKIKALAEKLFVYDLEKGNYVGESVVDIENKIKEAVTDKVRYRNCHFYYISDEVRTSLLFNPVVESDLKDSNLVRDRYLYLCHNEIHFNLSKLDPNLLQDFDPNKSCKTMIGEPDIPALDNLNKSVLIQLIKVVRERTAAEEEKIFSSSFNHLINYLERDNNNIEDKRLSFIMAKLAQKHIFANRDMSRTVLTLNNAVKDDLHMNGYIRANTVVKWSTINVQESHSLFMATLSNKEI